MLSDAQPRRIRLIPAALAVQSARRCPSARPRREGRPRGSSLARGGRGAPGQVFGRRKRGRSSSTQAGSTVSVASALLAIISAT